MNTPQEQITEYLMDYWPGASFEQLRNHAAQICKLFAPNHDKTHADAAKLPVDNLALEAAYAQMRKALVGMVAWYETPESDQPEKLPIRIRACEKALSTDCGKEFLVNVKRLEEQLWLESKESHERLNKLEDRLKTAAFMLRSAVYERTPLGDKWIDHFDIERQKAITEFLASVEGKP